MFAITRSSSLRQLQCHLQTRIRHVDKRALALDRLLSTLAVLEQREGRLNPSSLAAVSAAQRLGGSISAFVAGSGVKSVAEEASKVKGIEKVIYVDNSAYDRVNILSKSSIARMTTS